MKRSLLGTDLQIEQEGRQAFNLDTILLQSFVKIPQKSKTVLDLGTGVEIQEKRYLQALKNIELNDLQSRLSVLHMDIKDLKMKDVDVIVSNPPFFKVSETSNLNLDEEDTIARHEVMLNLSDLIKVVSKTLKFGGYFYMIHRPDRLEEIMTLCQKENMSVKRIRFVHPYLHHEANHVLIEVMKWGNPGLKVEKPLILYVEKHVLTKEMVDIYQGG